MRNVLFFIVAYLVQVSCIWSQDSSMAKPPPFFSSFYIEGGVLLPDMNLKSDLPIRQVVGHTNYGYGYDYSGGRVSTLSSGFTIGARYELFLPAVRMGVSSGLRFMQLDSEISGFSASNANFFHLRYYSAGGETKFARVTSLTEKLSFISIPLEVLIQPFEFEMINFYAKLGVDWRFLGLRKNSDINFWDSNMDILKSEVLESIHRPTNSFFATINMALGVSIGEKGRVKYNLELVAPSYYTTKSNFQFSDIESLGGIRLSVQVPISKVDINNKKIIEF